MTSIATTTSPSRAHAALYFSNATRDVARTIREKTEILGRMLDASSVNFANARQVAHESIFQHTPLIDEMDRVFEHLQATRVDPELVAGEPNKTLFDFVDAETVQSLQQDALEQTKEVEELLTTHEHALTRIDAIYAFFQSFEQVHGAALHALDASLSSNINSSSRSDSDDDAQHMEALYTTAVSFFVDMEQCDRFLRHYFTTINDIHPHYDALFAETQTLFDELRSLQDFYRLFVASHAQLTPELQRRRAYDDEVASLIDETRRKLAALEQHESTQRVRFCHDYARFLPASLCPQIKFLPEQFDIVRVDDPLETSPADATEATTESTRES